MSFEHSPFAKSLYKSGGGRAGPSSPLTPKFTPTTPTVSSPLSPATPIPNTFRPSTPAADVPTGSWTHPSLEEIQRRTVNKELLVKKIITNVAVAATVYVLHSALSRVSLISDYVERYKDSFSLLDSTYSYVVFWGRWAAWILYVLSLFNVSMGVYTLVRSKDNYDDLPVTPSQRKLLGLPASPHSAKTSPTPPKYVKSSPQARISPRPSPLSRRLSTSSPLSKYATGTTVSPSGSPLVKKEPVKATSAPAASTPAASTTTPVKSTGSPSPLKPPGRYIYLSESSPRRRGV